MTKLILIVKIYEEFFFKFSKNYLQKPNGKIIFDFKNPDALRCLTLILLKKDFGLELNIPENKLIPTLPLRLNYILWIEDLLDWTAERQFSVSGVDIGKNFIYLLINFFLFRVRLNYFL